MTLSVAAVATFLLGHLLGHWIALPGLVIAAATVGVIVSPLLTIMSFVVAPALSIPLGLECVRLGWILLWIAASWLVVWATLAAV